MTSYRHSISFRALWQAGFLSLAHTDADIDKTIAAAKEVFATL